MAIGITNVEFTTVSPTIAKPMFGGSFISSTLLVQTHTILCKIVLL